MTIQQRFLASDKFTAEGEEGVSVRKVMRRHKQRAATVRERISVGHAFARSLAVAAWF